MAEVADRFGVYVLKLLLNLQGLAGVDDGPKQFLRVQLDL